ncbi:MAG: RsmD family RNA methyltransferase [bacterium]|nr:RsmD family RNA methyltransferase [bacterium]
MQKIFPMRAEKIAHDGAALGEHEGCSVHVHGMLPGEEGIVEAHKKHGMYIGALKELTYASPRRKNPEELHYLSCSPWQVIEYSLQVELKQGILRELFSYYPDAPKVSFVLATQFYYGERGAGESVSLSQRPSDDVDKDSYLYGYRTKVEFSFCDREGEIPVPLSLAFHVRGGGSNRIQLPKGCALASESMNRAALTICARLRDLGYVARDLKTLIIRESKSSGKLLAMLYAKKEDLAEFPVDDIPNLAGFFAFHSTEKSPASVETKELWRWGEDTLTERVCGLDMSYSRDAFFQNNIPLFERAMEIIAGHVAPHARVIELYAGVGTIGLSLARQAKMVHGIEIIPAATAAAKNNAVRNHLTNYVAECIPAEKMDARLLDGKDMLVLDPPRSGLHPKVIAMIKEKLPPKIIYLSCNPETQARDYSQLSSLYKIDSLTGFDFYPQTPHLESLLVLNLRTK